MAWLSIQSGRYGPRQQCCRSQCLRTRYPGRKPQDWPLRCSRLFGDGSFYLLEAPGHATGHMCGLARTTADPPLFVFMGADA